MELIHPSTERIALESVDWSQENSIWSCCSQSRNAEFTTPASLSGSFKNWGGMFGNTTKWWRQCALISGSISWCQRTKFFSSSFSVIECENVTGTTRGREHGWNMKRRLCSSLVYFVLRGIPMFSVVSFWPYILLWIKMFFFAVFPWYSRLLWVNFDYWYAK